MNITEVVCIGTRYWRELNSIIEELDEFRSRVRDKDQKEHLEEVVLSGC
jgi:short-subunit dehydrogenase involved in D-alanine esterification of teichoic acids